MTSNLNRYTGWLVLSCGVLLTSCLASVQSGAFKVHKGTFEDDSAKVRERATFEMDCPKDQIELVVLDVSTDLYNNNYPKQIGATGCGKKAIYVRTGSSGWVMNTESNGPKQ